MKSTAAALAGLLLASLPLQAAVVTTADNESTAGDGKTSFLEALTSLADNETITFNIPGAGPHYIATPAAGYPLITKSNFTIDGYSQPGASANTAGLRQPNNAVLRIVLDSRTDQPAERRRVIDVPGFGTSESCVLGLQDAKNARITGLAFIGVGGQGNDGDPHVYNIALIKGSTGAKIQGCWFGLDPAKTSWAPGPDGIVPGVHGARSAVASFKWNDESSENLIFGTDGNGTGDTGEFNLCVAQRLAVHLQTPKARVSGNWFNFFPDGSLLNPDTLSLENGSLEAIENGDGTDMLIGTDGNGVSDANEGNIIGRVVYDTFIEFWRVSPRVTIAGNSFGMGLDGFPAFTSPASSFIAVRGGNSTAASSVRIGSDLNGSGDAAEANQIYGVGLGFISWHGSNNDINGSPARISLRGNELIGNYGGIPLDSGAGVSAERVYTGVMADPLSPDVTFSSSSSPLLLQGTAPVAAAGVTGPRIDVYIADVFGIYQGPSYQGRSYLGSFNIDGAGDINPAPGIFGVVPVGFTLTTAEIQRVTLTANYTLPSGLVITTSFSPILDQTITQPPPLDNLTIAPVDADVKLSWTGGTPPFRIFATDNPAGPWNSIANTNSQTLTTPRIGPNRFYKVREGAPPR